MTQPTGVYKHRPTEVWQGSGWSLQCRVCGGTDPARLAMPAGCPRLTPEEAEHILSTHHPLSTAKDLAAGVAGLRAIWARLREKEVSDEGS